MDWVIRTLNASQAINIEQGEMIDLLHGDFDWEELFDDEEKDVVLGVGAVPTRAKDRGSFQRRAGL